MQRDLYRKNASGAGSEVVVVSDPREKHLADVSPDGEYVLFQIIDPSIGPRLMVYPLSGERAPVPLGFPKGNEYRGWFSPASDNAVHAVPVNGEGRSFQYGAPTRLFQFRPKTPFIPYDVTADGQRFIVNNRLEGPDPMPITVVVNWAAEGEKQYRSSSP